MEYKRIESSKYLIYEDGRLFSEKKNRFLKGMITKLGYLQYMLDGKWEFSHRLVGDSFITKPVDWDKQPSELWEIDHLDENKLNNHWSNLEWVTHDVNVQRTYDRGREVKSGADHWLTGTHPSKESKKLMSDKKLGSKHPKFTGWYIVKGIKYGSSYEASVATGIPRQHVYRWCKSGKKGSEFVFEPQHYVVHKPVNK